jgi:hypothetical protein
VAKIIQEIRQFNPNSAAQLLATNQQQRRLRPGWVAYLAAQAKRGQLHKTTDAIGVDDHGLLQNGQHRLNAIIMADVTVELLYVEGLTKEAFIVTDIGAKRTAADTLHISTILAANINMVAMAMGKVTMHRVPFDVMADITAWWKPIEEEIFSGMPMRTEPGLFNSGVRVAAALQWALQTNDQGRNYVREQYLAALSHDTQAMTRPVATMWRRCSQNKFTSYQGRFDRLYLAFQAFDPENQNCIRVNVNAEKTEARIKEALLTLEKNAEASAEKSMRETVDPILEEAHKAAHYSQNQGPRPNRSKKQKWVSGLASLEDRV